MRGIILGSCFVLLSLSAAQAQVDWNRMIDLGREVLRQVPDPQPAPQPYTQSYPPPQFYPSQQPRHTRPQDNTYAPARLPREDIAEIQRRLTNLGYDPGPVDGLEGAHTRSALRQWERDRGLPAKGELSADTLSMLRRDSGSAISGGTDSAPGRNAAMNGAPSFDCTRASTADERTICASPGLAARDRALDRAYHAALDAAGPQERTRIAAEQRAWVAARRSCKDGAVCIKAMMDGRIASLSRAAGGDSAVGGQGGEMSASREQISRPGYADYVRMAIGAHKDRYEAERDAAGIAYRLATADPAECKHLRDELSRSRGDVFAMHDFTERSAARFEAALDGIARTDAMTVRMTDTVNLQSYDFAKGGYPIIPTFLIAGGRRPIADGRSAPPCDTGLALNHALGGGATSIQRMGLTNLQIDLATAVPGQGPRIMPMDEQAARAFDARNAQRRVELAANVRVEPPLKAFGPLRGRVVALEVRDVVSGRTIYTFPVKAELATAEGPRDVPTYTDFVNLALVSDLDGYLAEPVGAEIAYIKAAGDERECARLREMESSRDEFAMADFAAEAPKRFRSIAERAKARPRQFEIPIEAKYRLGLYDFNRQAFPLSAENQDITKAGEIELPGGARPTECFLIGRDFSSFLSQQFGIGSIPSFTGLTASNPGVPGVDMLPMPRDQARAFHAAGKESVVLKARLLVSARDQGRGALVGRIRSIAAYDPDNGKLLHEYAVAEQPQTPAAASGGQPLTRQLLARILAPVIVPAMPEDDFESAAISYLDQYLRDINQGNPPPGSPLSIEELRGQEPVLVVAHNSDRLRAAVTDKPVQLPLSISAEETYQPDYSREQGVTIAALSDFKTPDLKNGDLPLSNRGLPLYREPSWLDQASSSRRDGFREAIVFKSNPDLSVELERPLVFQDNWPIDLEEAVRRGLIGNASHDRDSVVARWQFEILGARMDKRQVIVSARFTGLTLRWASDGNVLYQVKADSAPSMDELRAAEAAAVPRPASPGDIVPPKKLMITAETVDLLQLRFLPKTADDGFIERMLIARFAYERSVGEDQQPVWGRFFPAGQDELPPHDQRGPLIAEFRAWTAARVDALPETMTLALDLTSGVAPYEKWYPAPSENQCRSATQDQAGQSAATEKQAMQTRLCKFLDAAWDTPEPILFLGDGDSQTGDLNEEVARGPRYHCGSDTYCAEIEDAMTEAGLERRDSSDLRVFYSDLFRLDRLPEVKEFRKSGSSRKLEIDLRITSAKALKNLPESIWDRARDKADAFDETYGLGLVARPRRVEFPGPIYLFDAASSAARLIDEDTGEVIASPELAAPKPLPLDLLDVPKSRTRQLDLLGIRLGTSFADAEKLIRGYMEVGRVLVADHAAQLGSISGHIEPYTSGRMYVSKDESEIITLYDEPPSAPGVVLGAWRLVRLPGVIDPSALKASLVERYGEPTVVNEVEAGQAKGLSFIWSDFMPEKSCSQLGETEARDLWVDKKTGKPWMPSLGGRNRLPEVGNAYLIGNLADEHPPLSSLCPSVLGVQFLRYPEGASDLLPNEIVSWLHDDRDYARKFYDRTPASGGQAGESTAASTIGIKF